MGLHIPSAFAGAGLLFLGLAMAGGVYQSFDKTRCRADNPGHECVFVPGYFAPAIRSVEVEGK